MAGWVKLHRCLLDKSIFDNEKMLKVFIWCLCKATHKEHEQIIGRQKVLLSPGEFVTGRKKAGEELNMKSSTAWDYLKLLESNKTINIKSNNKFSVITIDNWSLYQSEEENFDSKLDNKSTTNQPQINTNKNDKNVKNDNIFLSDSNEYRLADYLRKYMLKNNPNAKVPDDEKIQSWCKTINLMIRIDKRTIEDIKEHIKFSQTDMFWMANILSAASLRKKYDQLTMKMKVTELPKPKEMEQRANAAAYQEWKRR